MRLCSKVAIDCLFNRKGEKDAEKKGSCLYYPLRAIWIEENFRKDDYAGTRFLISVPKKKLRHAVDRVQMRRRIRESWRLNFERDKQMNLDVALVYIADRLTKYEEVDAAIKKILSKLPSQRENTIETP